MPTIEEFRWSHANNSQTAVFLWQGFMDVACPGGNYKTLTAEQATVYDSHFDGLGQDGGALSIGYIAAVLEEEFAARWSGQQDFPGVYHYEIVEPLGEWLAKEGPKLRLFQYSDKERDPAVGAVKQKYHEMMAAWFVTEKLTG